MKGRCATLEELSKLIGRSIIGNNSEINGLGLCNRKTQYNSILSYIDKESFVDSALANSNICALITTKNIFTYLSEKTNRFSYIICDNPEEEFYSLHRLLLDSKVFYNTEAIEPVIGRNCKIHKTAVIENNVIIGGNVTIGANSVINGGSIIGDNTRIGCCTIIGSEGFQVLKTSKGEPYNVIHVGGTKIGKNVWIGDNVTVCNTIFEGIVEIGDNTKIDNHCHIAHNCYLGNNNVLAAGVILFGSAEIRNGCWLAPGALVMNRVVVEDNAIVGANSFANSRVKEGITVIGTPAVPIKEFTKKQFYINKLIKNLINGKK